MIWRMTLSTLSRCTAHIAPHFIRRSLAVTSMSLSMAFAWTVTLFTRFSLSS